MQKPGITSGWMMADFVNVRVDVDTSLAMAINELGRHLYACA